MKKIELTFVLLVAIILFGKVAFAGFSDEYKFGDRICFGSNINSSYDDYGPSLTADGNTMYFASNRPDGYGDYDIYVSHRVNGVWQPAENAGSVINTQDEESDPAITPDGQTLYFASTPPGGPRGLTKIKKSERINGIWQTPTVLQDNVNVSSINNNLGFVTKDGGWLYMRIFGGQEGFGMWDIYRSQIFHGENLSAEHLPSPINTIDRDWPTDLTTDGKYFLFGSDRSGRAALYASEIVNGVYQTPEPLLYPLAYPVDSAVLTNDEMTAYISGENLCGLGGWDIAYAVRIIPDIKAKVDIAPAVLNNKSNGHFITVYVELENGYDVTNINIRSISLGTGTSQVIVMAENSPTAISDHDNDGVTDLMIKFDRSAVYLLLGDAKGRVELTLAGKMIDGKPFKGSGFVVIKDIGR